MKNYLITRATVDDKQVLFDNGDGIIKAASWNGAFMKASQAVRNRQKKGKRIQKISIGVEVMPNVPDEPYEMERNK